MIATRPHLLPSEPDVPSDLLDGVRADRDRFAQSGLPVDLEDYLRRTYGLDVRASYAGMPIRNPWGKASGQLSLNASQIEEAADAGLGFVVLKTVIARDAEGRQSMAAWAIREARMLVEPITSPFTGAEGWTVTWKGRGWWQSFDEYLDLVRAGCTLGRGRGLLVIPSVKYHLPAAQDERWRQEEYDETTRALVAAYRSSGGAMPMPLEKDFSPTLAGSDRATRTIVVLDWLRRVPALIRDAAGAGAIKLGLKLFNSLEDDDFQLAMLSTVHGESRPDFLVYANRLFDPDRQFEGKRGVAYGGPDLSDRNLRLLTRLRVAQARGEIAGPPLEISGTGDITSGRIAVEYALRGCTSFQIHTMFQLPAHEFPMRVGSRLQRALHRLYFDPRDGLIVWMIHAARRLGLEQGGPLRFLDLARVGAGSPLSPGDLDARAS